MQSCIRCGGKYDYDHLTFGHMGGFRCPRCGYARPDTRLSVSSILSKDMDSSRILIDMDGTEYPVRVNLPAEYNIYNAAGAIAALTAMDFDPRQAIAAVEGFRCGFGRMERFDSIGSAGACMMLVKNPTGCSQVLEFISALDQECCVVLCINDRSGDGTDVPWLWDVEFEKLAAMGSKLDKVIVSGIRAADMWTRLKYAGIPDEHISLERDYDALAQKLGNMDKPIFIIPTYSAMMDCRAALVKHYGGAQFWEG